MKLKQFLIIKLGETIIKSKNSIIFAKLYRLQKINYNNLIMKRITILLILLLIAVSQGAFAQRTITGKVIDAEEGLSLPEVSVIIKGTNTGAATDIDGNFSMDVPDDATIVVSFIGYKSVEFPVGTQTQFEITLESDIFALDAFVVTALGIERDKKTLPYSLQTISGEEMMKASDINFMTALTGRVAGLEINQTHGGAGGSTRVSLRGAKTFDGSASPLYVIDGVPMVNRTRSQAGQWAGNDEGDGLTAINPDDIENVSVLKGVNAAILYGSQGANGVVLITTKRGAEGPTRVNYSSSVMFETPYLWPELQFRYGAIRAANAANAALVGPISDPVPLRDEHGYFGKAKDSWDQTRHIGNLPHKQFSYDDIKDFFRTGMTLTNTINISGGTNRTTNFFSYSNTEAKGVNPNNQYRRHNVSLRQSTKFFNDKVTLSLSVMLTDESRWNPPRTGFTENFFMNLSTLMRAQDWGYWKENWQVEDPARKLYVMEWHMSNYRGNSDHFEDNPMWVLNTMTMKMVNKRMIGNLTVSWDIMQGLKFTARGNYDYAFVKRDNRKLAGGNSDRVSVNGAWIYSEDTDRLAYLDFVLTYDKRFGDFSLTALTGFSNQESKYGAGVSASVTTQSNGFYFPNQFHFANLHRDRSPSQDMGSIDIKQGLFANFNIGFKDMIFLDLSRRRDYLSALAGSDAGNSYISHVIGISGIISNMVSFPDFITFGQIRGSYAANASDLSYGSISIFPNVTISGSGGIGTISPPTTPPWTDAKPEMHKSVEIGADWRFFAGRLGLDFTWYKVTNTDLIRNVTSLHGTGFESYRMNLGKIVNKGVEIMVDAEPISTGNFSWRTSVQFARNVNKLVEIDPNNPDFWFNITSGEGYVTRAMTGGSFGDLYAFDFLRDEQGRMIINSAGRPTRTRDVVYQGKATPDFSLGWNNDLTYKNWSLGFQIRGLFGGIVSSTTEAMLDWYGTSERSAAARDRKDDLNFSGGYVKVNGVNNQGNPVDKVDAWEYYARSVGGRQGIFANYIYDATNVKLQQVTLSYNIPVRQLNLPLRSASVGVVGTNLFFFYLKAPYDPNLTITSNNSLMAHDNFGMPASRSYGFNLRVNF